MRTTPFLAVVLLSSLLPWTEAGAAPRYVEPGATGFEVGGRVAFSRLGTTPLGRAAFVHDGRTSIGVEVGRTFYDEADFGSDIRSRDWAVTAAVSPVKPEERGLGLELMTTWRRHDFDDAADDSLGFAGESRSYAFGGVLYDRIPVGREGALYPSLAFGYLEAHGIPAAEIAGVAPDDVAGRAYFGVGFAWMPTAELALEASVTVVEDVTVWSLGFDFLAAAQR